MKDFLISFILESIVNIGEIFLFCLLLSHKFQLKKADVSSRLKLFSFLLLQVLILSTFNCTSTSVIVILVFLIGTDILFALLFFECSLMQSILWSGIYAIIGLFANYACILLPCAIAGVDANASLFGGSLHVPITFLHLIILAVIILILIHLNTKTLSFTGLQRCVYVLLSVFGTFVAYYLLSIVLHYTAGISEKNLIDELILILFAFLFFFFTLLLFIYRVGLSQQKNLELLEQVKQQNLEEQQLQNILEMMQTLRVLKHDMSIHMDTMAALLEKNDLSALKTYMQKYHHSIEQSHHFLSTGNAVMDCILSNKILYAKQLHFDVDYSLMIPASFHMDDMELSSLIGNLWNNAIEACLKYQKLHPDLTPHIDFFIKPYQNMVIFHMENSSTGIYHQKKDQTLLSTKPESGHGIGLRRIRSIAESAGGMIEISPKETLFTVHMMIPLEENCDETIQNCCN